MVKTARKVLGILGSPRRHGKVGTLLDKVLEEAAAGGHAVEVVHLYDLDIRYCRGCMACRSAGRCRMGDDLDALARKITAADVVILAAPTYWANVPAIVKNLFDRIVGYVAESPKGRGLRPRLSRNQEYVLITACTSPSPVNVLFRQSSGALKSMDMVFRAAGMRRRGTITLAGTRDLEQIPARILAQARRLGRAI